MQPVHQIASNVTRKHGKKQHDQSNDLSTVDPNLSRFIHFFRSKRQKLFGQINTECLTQKSSLSKHDESTVQMNLRSHRISAWQTHVSKLRNRKQCNHITFVFSSWNLRHFQKQLTFTLYLTTAGQNKCFKVLTNKSSSTGGSDQRGREEPELVLDPMWYVIFCTRRRSGRSCRLM